MPGTSALRSATSALALIVCLFCTACNFQELSATLFQVDLRSESSIEAASASPSGTHVTTVVVHDTGERPAETPSRVPEGHHDSEAVDYMSAERHGGPGEDDSNEWYGGSYEGHHDSDKEEYMMDASERNPHGEVDGEGEGYHDPDEAEYMSVNHRGGPDGGSMGSDEDGEGYHNPAEVAYMAGQYRGGPSQGNMMGSGNGSGQVGEGYHDPAQAAYMSGSGRGGPDGAMRGGGAGYQPPPANAQRPQPTNQPTAPRGNALVRLQRGIAMAQTTTAGTLMAFNIEYEASGISSDPNTRYLLLVQPPRGRARTMIVQLKPEGFIFATHRDWKDMRGEFQAQVLEERRGQGVRAISKVLKLPAG